MQYESRSTEKIYLLIFTVFVIFMIPGTVSAKPVVSIILTNIFLTVGWVIYFSRYGTKSRRAYILTMMTLLCCLYKAINVESFSEFFPGFVVAALMIGLFDISRLIYMEAAVFILTVLYHICILHTFPYTGRGEIIRELMPLVAVFLVMYLTDYCIRRRKHMQRELKETVERLKETEHSKDEFLANVSHEIRTPLNTICGMSELALREDLPVRAREEIFHIQTAGRGLQSIVSDVLDFSELETGKLSLNEEAYNFSSVMNDVINMAIAQNEEKQLELIVDCDAQIPRSMEGDSEQLCRIISNLVGNAIKFTEKGCVAIRASVRKERYGVNLCIRVQDTGIGMNAEEMEKLFTSFNQVDTKKNRSQGGIGLGIAILRKITDMMNGFLKVDSIPGSGSEFQFVIPQRVLDERPMIEVKNREEIHVITYINLEKFTQIEIRDNYTEMIVHMAEQLEVALTCCNNFRELERRMEKQSYTHLFVGVEEYREQTAYFTAMSKKMPVILVLGREDEGTIQGDFLCIYKPFYALSVAAALNGETLVQRMDGSHHQRNHFVAPKAAVLVVDDSMMNLKVMEGLLRPYEVRLFTAASGEEALKLLDWAHYDLIFMDHMMPKMDGIETLHQLRKKKGNYYQSVPVVALTANAIGGAREMFLTEGFDDFVAKPVEISVLERVLKKHLPAELIQFQEMWNKDPEIKEDWRIDTEQGLMYCGGEMEDYLEILQIYYESGLQKKEEIKELYAAEDWKEYTVLVHALKSTSQSIGANKLYEMAKAQELAGKEGQIETLAVGEDPLMQEYEAVLNEISERWGETDDKN